MATCCIPGCDNELSGRGRLRTCAVCRQSLHTWERRRPAEILERAIKLTKYRARMATFAIVKDDDVALIDHATLERKGIMTFPVRKAKRAAKSNVVSIKIREAKRRRA